MVKILDAREYDGCNACSFNSGHNRKNVKKIECDYISIYLCEVCREDMMEQLQQSK